MVSIGKCFCIFKVTYSECVILHHEVDVSRTVGENAVHVEDGVAVIEKQALKVLLHWNAFVSDMHRASPFLRIEVSGRVELEHSVLQKDQTIGVAWKDDHALNIGVSVEHCIAKSFLLKNRLVEANMQAQVLNLPHSRCWHRRAKPEGRERQTCQTVVS